MNRFIILMFTVAIGACAVIDVGDRDDGAMLEPQLDDPSAAPEAQVGDTESALAVCDGSPGQWPGCRGNGCAVCAELVGNAPCYFANHPACSPNFTCAGQYFTCNNACPQPTFADFCQSGPPCGDGVCNGNETCETCAVDCGTCGGGGPCGGSGGFCADGSECCGIDLCQDGSFCQ